MVSGNKEATAVNSCDNDNDNNDRNANWTLAQSNSQSNGGSQCQREQKKIAGGFQQILTKLEGQMEEKSSKRELQVDFGTKL